MRRGYLLLVCATFAAGGMTLIYRGPGWRWLRGWGGDALAASALVFALSAALAGRVRLVSRVAIAGFVATFIELGQLLPLSFRESGVFRLVLGARFDPMDFAWYAVGLFLATLVCLRVERSVPRTR